jgi:hypothetical protein
MNLYAGGKIVRLWEMTREDKRGRTRIKIKMFILLKNKNKNKKTSKYNVQEGEDESSSKKRVRGQKKSRRGCKTSEDQKRVRETSTDPG